MYFKLVEMYSPRLKVGRAGAAAKGPGRGGQWMGGWRHHMSGPDQAQLHSAVFSLLSEVTQRSYAGASLEPLETMRRRGRNGTG